MIPRILLLLTLAACGPHYPHVPDPQNPVLTGAPKAEEPEGECWSGPDTARIRLVCEAALTPSFVTQLQRALAARGLFDGVADGRMGPKTREAVRAYQATFGRDDPALAWNAAEALGLVAIAAAPRPDPET